MKGPRAAGRDSTRTRRVAGAAVSGFVLLAVGWPAPASAHPWGTPPEAVVSAAGDRVVVDWRSEPDDALLLGVELGLVDPTGLDWTQEGPQPPPDSGDEALLPPSATLEAYLLDHIRVVQDGAACEGRVEPFADFVAEGATTVHTCPQPVGAVDLEIEMLHDLHEAYRTFTRSADGAIDRQAVFTVSDPRHTWTFDAGADGGSGSAWREVLAMLGALVLASVAAVLAVRLRRRRAVDADDRRSTAAQTSTAEEGRELSRRLLVWHDGRSTVATTPDEDAAAPAARVRSASEAPMRTPDDRGEVDR